MFASSCNWWILSDAPAEISIEVVKDTYIKHSVICCSKRWLSTEPWNWTPNKIWFYNHFLHRAWSSCSEHWRAGQGCSGCVQGWGGYGNTPTCSNGKRSIFSVYTSLPSSDQNVPIPGGVGHYMLSRSFAYPLYVGMQQSVMVAHNHLTGLILHTWRGKAIFPWQRAPLWGICKFLLGLLKGQQGKDQG